ncbi:hypothetical protein RJ640_010127, partial [Escallonia rubra]
MGLYWQVARCLETVMVNAPTEVSHLANDAIHYNPSDVASWVDSLLSKLHQPKKAYPTLDRMLPSKGPNGEGDSKVLQKYAWMLLKVSPFELLPQFPLSVLAFPTYLGIQPEDSTRGYCVLLGPNLLSWSSQKQPTIAHSNTESEYKALAITTSE